MQLCYTNKHITKIDIGSYAVLEDAQYQKKSLKTLRQKRHQSLFWQRSCQ